MTSKKQELKRNDLADALEHKLEQIKPYTNAILLGVLVVVLAIAGITWLIIRQRAKTEEMWNDFYLARNTAAFEANARDLMTHAERYGDSASAAWARQLAADLKLQEGARTIYSDRDEGETIIREAIALYGQVIDEAKSDSTLHTAALYGRGQAYETLLDLDAARADYSAVEEAAEADSAMAIAAERRLTLLSDPQLESFATAFLSYDPTDSSSSSDFLPPTTNPNAPLPLIPDISFPTSSLNTNQGNNEGLKTPEDSNPGGDSQTSSPEGATSGDDNQAGDDKADDSPGENSDAGQAKGDQAGDKSGSDDSR